MLNMVKMPLKGEVGGHALNSHGNYIVDHGKSWKNHGIIFLNFRGNPVCCVLVQDILSTAWCWFNPGRQEIVSQHHRKIVDWDVKHQNKQKLVALVKGRKCEIC